MSNIFSHAQKEITNTSNNLKPKFESISFLDLVIAVGVYNNQRQKKRNCLNQPTQLALSNQILIPYIARHPYKN